MNLQKSFHQALDILQLKEATMQEVAADSHATPAAFVFVALGAVATALGASFFPVRMGMIVYRPDLFWMLQLALAEMAGILAVLYFGGFAAEKWFHAQLSMNGFVRVMGHAAILGVLALVPALQIFCLWELVVLWRLCTRVAKLELEQTVLFLLLLMIVSALLSSSLGFY